MKYIKSRNFFLSEAKIKDVVFPRQAKEIQKTWGEAYLEQEEIIPTDKIKQGTWKLSDEDKMKVLGAFFEVDMVQIYEKFRGLPQRFCDILKQSIDVNILPEAMNKYSKVLNKFDIKQPSVDEIYLLFDNVFRKLAVGDTKSDNMIQKDERGRPVLDETGKPVRISKEIGAPVFTNNLININAFVTDYNNCYPSDAIDTKTFAGGISQIRNLAGEDFTEGAYEIDFEIFSKDLYLQIVHKPSDILNMSISRFFSSCQHLYTGGFRSKVLSNVFDPNSIPAFLKFDTPIFWKGEKISDQVPLSRMQIRNIEGYIPADHVTLYFDRCYPDRMEDIMFKMVEKYSGNKSSEDVSGYLFSPDIDTKLKLDTPYMDRLSVEQGTYIGVNSQKLYIGVGSNWSNVRISPKAQIKELTVETVQIPKNLLKLNLDLEWIKFKYLNLKKIDVFNFKTKAIGFEKCKFKNNIIEEISNKFSDVKKLSIVSCDISNLILAGLNELEELHLIYTLDSNDELSKVLEGLKLKRLEISGDLLSREENKKYIQLLKKSGTTVKTIGLVI